MNHVWSLLLDPKRGDMAERSEKKCVRDTYASDARFFRALQCYPRAARDGAQGPHAHHRVLRPSDCLDLPELECYFCPQLGEKPPRVR